MSKEEGNEVEISEEIVSIDTKVEESSTMASKRLRVPLCVVGVILTVGLVCGGVAFTANGAKATEEPTKPAAEQKAGDVKLSSIKLTVEAQGTETATGATKAKISATDRENKEAINEFEVEINKEVEVGKLDPGTYELYITCTPVLADGATYKLPENPQKFVVSKDGKATVLRVKLEIIAKEDMTKEQLEAAASVLVENGKADAANQVVEAAKSAPSVEGSANAIQRPAAPSNNNGGNSGGNTPAPAPAPTPNPEPSKPQHSHSWNPQYTTVNVPAVYENQWVSNWVVVNEYICGTCGALFNTPQEAVQHQKANGWSEKPCGGYYSNSYEVDQGSYQSVLITPASSYQQISGYSCSCGATK